MSPSDDPGHSRLGASDISIAYGQRQVLSSLSLDLPDNRFTALLGPNGSGKSSLLRALGGLHRPASGCVHLDGHPVSGRRARHLARQVAILAQGPITPEGVHVEDLVRQGRYPHRPFFGGWSASDDIAVERALDRAGLSALRSARLDTLSGGQRQRAWIAMALAQDTKILLLDEPTTFLDPGHQIDVMELASDLVRHEGKTIVAVLHDLNQAARYADHMVLLADGGILAQGSPSEVMTADAIERAFGIRCVIRPDPFTATPTYVPLPRQSRVHDAVG